MSWMSYVTALLLLLQAGGAGCLADCVVLAGGSSSAARVQALLQARLGGEAPGHTPVVRTGTPPLKPSSSLQPEPWCTPP